MRNVKMKTEEEWQAELDELRHQLFEAHETIEAIRTGQIDALVVEGTNGNELYTLKTADQAYRVFIEKMTEGAVTLNKEGIILYCNSQFASMVAQPLSNVIGSPFRNFIASNDIDRYQSIFRQCWTKDCKEEVLLKRDDHNVPVQLSLTSIELENGLALSLIVTDLSAQKKTQQQLEESNRQLAQMNQALEVSNHDLQQFASVASHDLQEPLRKIQIFSRLLLDKIQHTLTPTSKKYLDKIIDSAGRMKVLIVDVLNYSKLSAHDNVFERVDLNRIVAEVLEDFELLIQEKGGTVTVADLPCIDVNRGQIRQVFQNVLSNALKFTETDIPPVIQIRAERSSQKSFDSAVQQDGPYCLISIKDNGIGFDEAYLANIFALFERLHSKDSYEGTGIGLAITKKIVEKHNGLVSAKSQPGKGSEFLLLLPVTQEK
jgi:PAS domain S-box-containing protein